MDQQSKAAYIFSQSVAAFIEAQGMIADNLACLMLYESPVYAKEAFQALIDKYGLSHDSVLGYLRD